MKLLIVTDAWQPQINGVVRTYEYLSEEMRKRGHDVKVIGPDSFMNMPMPGYKEISLAIFPYRKLRRMIREFDPDRIHIPVEGPLGQAARLYCKRNKIPFTTSYHTHFPDYVAKRVSWLPKRFRRYLRSIAIAYVRRFHKKSSAMMVATQSLEDELNAWGFRAEKKRLIRGARLALFHPGEKTLFQDMPKPIQLYVGRVAVEKNIEAFLEADTGGTKVIVGDGPSREKLAKKYPEAIFAGKKVGEELAEYYRSADVFVFPSRTDTFGIVLIEALASGVPVVAYDVTGPRDIVTEPYLGVLTEDLAEGVKQVLESGTAEQRVAHIKERYAWEKVAETFENYLNALPPKAEKKR